MTPMAVTVTDPSRASHVLLNTGSAARNLQRIRSIAPQAKVMAVIKANAYGHGVLRIARALADRVDAFAVARTDEALTLRENGTTQRIAVLQGFVSPEELQAYTACGLEPVIHSGWQIELLENTPLSSPLRVWLKLDTGMHRLGLLPSEFTELLERLRHCRNVIQPVPIMSHLSSADELENPATAHQLALFMETAHQTPAERSVANSAGLFGWQDAITEWVRPGISLYGVSPFPERTGKDEHLEPVMTFRTRLISIKEISTGSRVGYGGDWICPHPTRLGVAAVGYGDGYPRLAESGTPVLIRSQRVPLVGRVSMDMITLDLTGCPDAAVGDLVTLWGEGLPVEEIARQAGTIPYDLLCGITQRVRVIEV